MFWGPAWHGPALRATLRGVAAREACRRPGARRHNIAEIAVHAAYWKHLVRCRIADDAQDPFPLAGSNFFPRVALGEREWRRDVELLEEQHRLLIGVVSRLGPRTLKKRVHRSRWTVDRTISGAAAHDAYHAGQIRLINRLIAR
jgi:hypothetical protein